MNRNRSLFPKVFSKMDWNGFWRIILILFVGRKIRPISTIALTLALWYIQFELLTLLYFQPFCDPSDIQLESTLLHPEIHPAKSRNCNWLCLPKIPYQLHKNSLKSCYSIPTRQVDTKQFWPMFNGIFNLFFMHRYH